jgi:hypothetical protein
VNKKNNAPAPINPFVKFPIAPSRLDPLLLTMDSFISSICSFENFVRRRVPSGGKRGVEIDVRKFGW